MTIKAVWRVTLLAVLAASTGQAPVGYARKQKPAAPKNTTFPACNSGTSRLAIANLDQLPQHCRPAHNHVSAAVHACFEIVRIKVDNCQLLVHPTAMPAKENPICKLMYARGALTGPSNASLVGVFDKARYDIFLKDHPDFLKNTNTSALQHTFMNTLAQLYGRAVLVQGKGKCSAAAAASHKAKVTQAEKVHSSRHTDKSHPVATPGVDAAAGKHEGKKDAAMAVAAAGNHTGSNKALPANQNSTKAAGSAHSAAGNTTAAHNNSTNPAKTSVAAASSNTAAGTSKGIADTVKESKAGSNLGTKVTAPGSVAASNSTGHRRLLLEQLEQQPTSQMMQPDRHLLKHAAAAATDASVSRVCTKEQEAQEIEEEFKLAVADSSSSIGNSEGSVLYLQGSKHIVLQPDDQCQFKYIVNRNPSLLQPAEGFRAADFAARGRRRRGEAEDGVAAASSPAAAGAAWTVFSSISVVLGVLVVFMAVKLVARRNDTRYDALQTSEAAANPAANGGRVQLVPTAGSAAEDGQQRLSSLDCKQNASMAWSDPGDTHKRDDRSRLLKDSSRSDGGAVYGRGR